MVLQINYYLESIMKIKLGDYEVIPVTNETRTIDMPVLDEKVRPRGLEEFGYEGDHGQVVTIDVRKEVYICPICEEENVLVMVNNRIIFGSSCYNKHGHMCTKCSSLTREEMDARYVTGSFINPVTRTRQELEGHTIIVDGGDTFWGDVGQFRDCFFDNADEDQIIGWCDANDMTLKIIKGIIAPPPIGD
jgi:hypothetical protein